MDGVHSIHNVQPAYDWIKKGVRKEIPDKIVIPRAGRFGEFGLAATSQNRSFSLALHGVQWSRSFGSILFCLADSKFTKPSCARYSEIE